MRTARYIPDDKSQSSVIIGTSAYDPKTHKGHLQCPEDGCEAPVHFRRGHLTDGGSAGKESCFVSNSIPDHKDGCPSLRPGEFHPQSVSLKEALQEGHAVIINLNGQFGHYLRGTFGSVADARQKFSPYNRERQKTHATIPVDTLADFEKAVEAVQSRAPDFSDIMVGHVQDIRRLSTVLVDQDKQKIKTLVGEMGMKLGYQNLTDGDGRLKVYNNNCEAIPDFPRRIIAQLSQRTIEKLKGNNLDSRQFICAKADGDFRRYNHQRIVLLWNFSLANNQLIPEVFTHDRLEVLATPFLTKDDVHTAFMSCARGETGFLKVHLRIDSKDQVAPAEYATPLRRQMPLFDGGTAPTQYTATHS